MNVKRTKGRREGWLSPSGCRVFQAGVDILRVTRDLTITETIRAIGVAVAALRFFQERDERPAEGENGQ